MPNLIIKPQTGSGNSVILQDQGGAAVLTTADSGGANVNIGSSSTFPAGHIIKTGYIEVGTTSTYNSATFTETPLLIDHVAKASGSYIYIMCQLNTSFNLSTGTGYTIRKDNVNIGVGTLESGHESNVPSNISFYPTSRGTNYAPDSMPIQVMDDSGAIVAGTTYRYRLYIATHDGSHAIYLNRGASWGTGSTAPAVLSTMYLHEIAQ